jgi:hypothetical protein
MLTQVMVHLRDELLIIRSNLLLLYDSNDSIGFVHGKSNFFFIEILEELRLFIDKKVILSENNVASFCHPPSDVQNLNFYRFDFPSGLNFFNV